MNKQQIFLVLLLCFLSKESTALDEQKYSLRDSVRGSLSMERSCFDVTFYDLKVEFNMHDSSIVGANKIVFNVVSNTTKIQLDLFQNMVIDSVIWHARKLTYHRVENAFYVDFPITLPMKSSQEVEVFYHGQPILAAHAPWEGGFVWSTDEKNRPFVGVACEGIGASLWWPNKDHLSDKPDSMALHFIVPQSLNCVANGSKVNCKPYAKDSLKKHWQWKVTYPIINYNVTFYLGMFEEIEDYYVSHGDSLMINYFVLDYHVEKARSHFKQVKPMLKVFEDLYGRYPFWNDGYKLVDAPYMGMEHQSAIAYGNRYKTGYLGKQMKGVDFDYVIVHESGHEYWGNSISMDDLADMWIHEAFCTYSEALYVEKIYGHQMMLSYIKYGTKDILNDAPIIPDHGVNTQGSQDMYLKGSLMLHLVRSQLANDNLWFQILKEMQEKFAYQSLGTDKMFTYLESSLGKEVMPIMKHYLYKSNLPILSIKRTAVKNQFTMKWMEVVKGFKMNVSFKQGDAHTTFLISDKPVNYDMKIKSNKKPEAVNFFGAFEVQYEN